MRVDIITIFPEYFVPLDVSLLGRARAGGLVDVRVHDLRRWAIGPHRAVDDAPYGGGPGMVMRPEPWGEALAEITSAAAGQGSARVIVPTPAGRPFRQTWAAELAAAPWLVFCCGRYEGIDERVIDEWADDEVSLGDYVLAGGEVAALVVLESVTRLVPGVVGNTASVSDDSFSHGLLEAPVYTRPASWEGRDVPGVLLSGDHATIARWRRTEALRRTARRRPELLASVVLSEQERADLGVLSPVTGIDGIDRP